MPDSFFFYDLETSGISARRDRIMQFGGQRTDANLNNIGEPVNILVRLSDDILPAPEAVLLSHVSPAQTQSEGVKEYELVGIFNKEIAKASTIFTGFNNVRFDDEFIRYLNYRNFYDAYSWHWRDQSSRWDILDVVRMTRALRPEGIVWPFDASQKPTNRLELLSQSNNLKHASAHDALSDALATIEVARLIKKAQPKLFSYLLSIRQKTALIDLIESNNMLVYTSSHFSSQFLHTTVVSILHLDKAKGTALAFDLRFNPKDFLDLSIDELTELWRYDPDNPKDRLPAKTIKLNRCPSLAPTTVLDKDSLDRLQLNMNEIEANSVLINDHKSEFATKLQKVASRLDKARDDSRAKEPRIPAADERLYDGFISKVDSNLFKAARTKAKLSSGYEMNFEDNRLNDLYSLYRARNYTDKLNAKDQEDWRMFVRRKLFDGNPSQYSQFTNRISELIYETTEPDKLKLLEELKKYGSTIEDEYGADLKAVDV